MPKKTISHLKGSDMSYIEHLMHAYKNGLLLMLYAISSFIHGLFPALLPQHAARGVIRMFYNFQKLPHLVIASEEEKLRLDSPKNFLS